MTWFRIGIQRSDCSLGGGIFCEACAQFDLASSESSEYLRGCGGCYRGECPGDQLKRYIRSQLADLEVKDPFKKVITFGARIGQTFGYKQGTPPAASLKLLRGSKYGEDGRIVSNVHPLPISGNIFSVCPGDFRLNLIRVF